MTLSSAFCRLCGSYSETIKPSSERPTMSTSKQIIVSDTQASSEVVQHEDGFSFQIVYPTQTLCQGKRFADIYIDIAHALKLKELPEEVSRKLYLQYVHVTLDNEVLLTSYGLASLDRSVAIYNQRQTTRSMATSLREVLNLCLRRLDDVESEYLFIRVYSMIERAERLIDRLPYPWYERSKTYIDAQNQLRAIDHELTRIENGSSQLLIDDLLAELIDHPDIQHNLNVIEQITQWSIRTDGFIEVFGQDSLRRFYETSISENTTVAELLQLDLKLDLNEYVPESLLDELDCAPESIEITGRKSSSFYPVSYSFSKIGGDLVPVGRVSIPLGICERNAGDYGKKSRFPELPFGIKLLVTVTSGDAEIATGFDDEKLAERIRKHKKSKNRSKSIEDIDGDELSGRRRSRAEAHQIPSWYKGRKIRL